MKLIRYCQDSFYRDFGEFGYITNQLYEHDRVYDQIGNLFLRHVKRHPRSIESIVRKIYSEFTGVNYDTIRNDFLEFIHDLEKLKFVITSNSYDELNKKESFLFNQKENINTSVFQHKENRLNDINYGTKDFFYDHFHGNNQLVRCEIEITSCCNEKCIHCYIPHKTKNININSHLMHTLLDQLYKMKTLGIILSGGECMLHPQFIDFLYHARQNDFSISILSNLTLLTDEIIQAMKEVRIHKLQTSVYSMNPDVHDAITQTKGSFKKTIHNIERLLDNNIPVQISCPVMKCNQNTYLNVLKWAQNHGIKTYTDYIMIAKSNFDTDNLTNRLSILESEKLIKNIVKYNYNYIKEIESIKPITSNMEKFKQQPVCGAGIDSICVFANGNLYPCSGWQEYVVGNLYDDSLMNIWKNSKPLEYLRKITNSDFPKCLNCEARDFCTICMVRNYNESNGDIFKINPYFCQIAFLNKKIVNDYKKNKSK